MSFQPPIDEKSVFNAARKITDAEAREQYLKSACGDDSRVLQRIRDLLSVHQTKETFLESPPVRLEATEMPQLTERPGDQIGSYKLLQTLGEGGMGVVYLGEQREPVERLVAVKIIKPGMDSRRVIARFEAERQALAMMDHPNIARVFDAGTTETGRPYFVMELVKGTPITQHCDEHRLDCRQRLALFQDVCHAVQHAHQKGIIHRDLKPSNVLVTEYDDRAVPKIIDFGVAKATQHQLTTKTLFTEVGTVVGTIEYMSPEQAKLSQLDIDTRSDIYSLGVLLYELLTGEMPFDRKRLRSAALDEMLRIIREEEPSRPSLKLDTSESLPSIAVNRKTEPKRLTTLIRGELDWIVMKALEKDRSRRYDTANAFASDIGHYLNDEAVQACPPSAAYRFRKFVRRNKQLAVTTCLFAATLIFGMVATSWQAWRASHQRDRAIHAESLAERRLASEQAARVDAETARKAESAARSVAQRAAAERRQALVRQYVRRGTEYVDDGDHTTALPWFLKALELDSDDPDRARVHRLRIATTMERCPKLISILNPKHNVHAIEFFADGRRVLLRAHNRSVSVWNLDGAEVGFPIDLGNFAALSADGTQIAICRRTGEVIVADAEAGTVKLQLESEVGRPTFAGFSPRGDGLFVVYDNRTIRVWNASSGEAVTPMLDEDCERIEAATFSTSGKYLIASDNQPGSPDLLLIWDLEEPGPARRLPWLKFSGWQGRYLAAGSSFVACPEDVFVGVASVKTGKRLYPHLTHADGVESVRLSRDEQYLLTSGTDHTARIWDAESGEPVTDWLRHNARVSVAEFSPDGQLAMTGSVDGEISVWNISTGQRVLPTIRHPDRIAAACFTPDSRRLVTSSVDGGTRVWDLATALPSPSLARNLGRWVMSCVFVGDGKLLVRHLGSCVQLYDLESKELVGRPFDDAAKMQLHPDRKSFVTAGANRVTRVRLDSGKTIFDREVLPLTLGITSFNESGIDIDSDGQPHVSASSRCVLDSDGKYIVVHSTYPSPNDQHSRLHAIDAKTGKSLSEMYSFDAPINDAAITSDGEHWIGGIGRRFAPYLGCRVEIRSLPELKLLRSIPFQDTIRSICITADGSRIVVGGGRTDRPGFIQVFDFATCEALTPPVPQPGPVETLQLLNDDTRVLSSSRDGTLRYWDIRNGQSVAPEIRVGRWVKSWAVDPDERWVATGTATNNMRGKTEQYLRFWDLQTGEPISPPFPHADGIQWMAVAPDGKRLATCSRDTHLRVMDLPQETRPLEELRQLTAIHAGIVLDELDNPVIIDQASLKESCNSLRERYPDEFQAVGDESIAWLRQRIDADLVTGDSASAVKLLDRLIVLDPQDPQLYRTRIQLNKKLGRYEAIPQDTETLQRVYPHDADHLASLALQISHESDPERSSNDFALQLADRAVAMSPENANPWRYRALIHQRDQNTEAAIADLEKVVQLQPGNFRPWYELALLKLNLGDRDGYDKTCRNMVTAIPPSGAPDIEESVIWICSLGAADVDDWEEILQRAKSIAEYRPGRMDYRNAHGAAHLRAGNYGLAYQELVEADRLLNDPSNVMQSSPAYSWYLLAITCQRLGFDDDAESWYQKAHQWSDDLLGTDGESESTLAVAWNRRITLDLLQQEATQALQDELAADETDPQVWLGRAAIYHHHGDLDAFESALDRAVGVAGDQSLPWIQRAKWHLEAGRDEDAQADFLEAFRRDLARVDVSKIIPLLESRAKELRSSRPSDPSIKRLEGIIDDHFRDYYTHNFPTKPTVQDLIERGTWFQKQGSYDKAIESYSAAIELEPSASVLKQVAGLHIALKQWEEAIECYDQLVKLQPHDIYFLRNRAMCEFLSRGLDAYRARCREAVERFLTPEASIEEKRVVAVLCTLVPHAVDDTGAIVELAREVAAEGILAKALLNDGQVDEALTRFHELADGGRAMDKVGICFNLAIAYQMSGKPDIAREWLEKGQLRLAEQRANGEFNNGHFRLNFRVTQNEAHRRLGIPMASSDRATDTEQKPTEEAIQSE